MLELCPTLVAAGVLGDNRQYAACRLRITSIITVNEFHSQSPLSQPLPNGRRQNW